MASHPLTIAAAVLLLLVLHLATGAVENTTFEASSWVESTSTYFTSNSSNANTIQDVRFTGITTSGDDVVSAMLAGVPRSAPNRVELWGRSGTRPDELLPLEDVDMTLYRKWRSASLAEATPPTIATVISTLFADFARRDQLDVLVQSSEGQLYTIATDAPTQAPQPVQVVLPAGGLNIKMKDPKTPQVGLANLYSPCGSPDLVYVNTDGALVVLVANASMFGRDCRAASLSTDSGDGSADNSSSNSSSSDNDDDDDDDDAVMVRKAGTTAASTTALTTDDAPPPLVYRAQLLADPTGLLQLQPKRREVVPFSLSMEDVNGDCAAELLFAVRDTTAQQLEVYAVLPEENYTLRRLLTLSEKTEGPYGIPVATDINGDGAVDLVVPVCATHTSSGSSCTAYKGFKVFYNNMTTDTECDFTNKYTSSVAAHAAHFTFGFPTAASTTVELTWDGCGLTNMGTTTTRGPSMPSSTTAPLILRPGDYSRDGYMDLVVSSSSGPLLLTSVLGGTSTDGLRQVRFSCTPLSETLALQDTTSGAMYTTAVPFFVSLHTMGRLDVVLTSFATSVTNGMQPNFVYSNTDVPDRHYAFIASALSGTAAHATLHQPGAVHRFHWQDTQMKTRRARATQLARTQAHALQPPRLHFGLGVTFSYVQEFTVGLRVSEMLKGRLWPSYLVPQAQVFAVLRPILEPSRWTLQLYLQTSHYKALLLIVLVSCLVVLGVPIVLLRCKEVREDFRNRWSPW